METVTDFIFLGFKITADYDCKHEIKGCSWKESSDKPRQHIEKQGIILPTKVRLVKATAFPVVMYGCESWAKKKTAPKNWCFWTVLLEKILESALNCKEIKPINSKGNQSWIFIGRTDAEAEALILWPPDAKCRLIRKDPNAGEDWRREEMGMTEDKIVAWYH